MEWQIEINPRVVNELIQHELSLYNLNTHIRLVFMIPSLYKNITFLEVRTWNSHPMIYFKRTLLRN